MKSGTVSVMYYYSILRYSREIDNCHFNYSFHCQSEHEILKYVWQYMLLFSGDTDSFRKMITNNVTILYVQIIRQSMKTNTLQSWLWKICTYLYDVYRATTTLTTIKLLIHHYLLQPAQTLPLSGADSWLPLTNITCSPRSYMDQMLLLYNQSSHQPSASPSGTLERRLVQSLSPPCQICLPLWLTLTRGPSLWAAL